METQNISQKSGQINIVLNNSSQKKLKNDDNNLQPFRNPFSSIEQKLSSFIGLSQVKKTIKEIYATKLINDKRKEHGLLSSDQVLHMLFKGNPGTGKTTLARQLAKLYYELNILSKGHIVEVERADLVGEYIGQTAQKTKSVIQKSMGGILFVDEAYSLARGGNKDFGKEAIDTLVKHMEDKQNDFALILAGYSKEMDYFLNLNPGLKSRFPFIIDFEDYDINQLLDIGKQMALKREYQLTKGAEWKLKTFLYKKKNQVDANFSNARCVRNMIEDAIRVQSMRLIYKGKLTSDDLIYLIDEDFNF